MKKIVAICLILAMGIVSALAFSACGDYQDVAGRYYGRPSASPATTYVLTLNANGSFVITRQNTFGQTDRDFREHGTFSINQETNEITLRFEDMDRQLSGTILSSGNIRLPFRGVDRFDKQQ